MSALAEPAPASSPRWDGRRVLFEITADGQRIECAISRGALDELSTRRHYKPAELLLCFVNARPRIEAIARDKLRARADGISGTLSIWADDLDDMPADSAAAPV